ncbi:MAG: formimidoylglutamase [Flavobacteriaceae bacterium]|nr:formimidoylglutamase [Flavobacteriaceae bacterium]
MGVDYLSPVSDSLYEEIEHLHSQSIGKSIKIHSVKTGLPDLNYAKLAIIGVQEGRLAVNNESTGEGLELIRKEFYQLYQGNWTSSIVDLGNIIKGSEVSDTYFALIEVLRYLLKRNIIPIIIGGEHDLTYANYRAYDSLEQMVNLAVVDHKFDLGVISSEINSQSYLSKIIMEQPNNLFNYSNIGYQSYFVPQDEIDLLDSMYFDSIRLGEAKKIENVEPLLRDADIVSIDISVVRQSEAPANQNATPNGFYGDEICAVARYAGISDKVTSFGIYEYNPIFDRNNQTAQLVAQMIWYFIEGVNFRANDYPFGSKENYQKYIVPVEDEDLIFFKSIKSGRWWFEININENNNIKRKSLIPCTYQEYVNATNQEIPERWYKTIRKII